jgi:tetratricopeptide (TPR) repeat protein
LSENLKNLDEKTRALRKELSQRTVNMSRSGEEEHLQAGGSPEIISIGKEISQLIDDERLEEARDRLNTELKVHTDELLFLNLQMILDSLDKPYGSYDKAKEIGAKLIEMAVEKDSPYYLMVGINNLGFIAHNEGHDELSKAMYLTAHFIDRKALFALCNLAGWHARRNLLDEAQKWVDRIIETYPDWLDNEEIVLFFKKDESLYNLKNQDDFREKVLSKISEAN